MAWIESHTKTVKHHKVLRMAMKIGIKPAHLIGHLHCLWWNVLELREDGDISVWTAKEVATYAEYEGKAEDFDKALDDERFTIRINGRRLINDWLDYAGRYLQAKYRSHNREKWEYIKNLYNQSNQPNSTYLPTGHSPSLGQTAQSDQSITKTAEDIKNKWNAKMPFKIKEITGKRLEKLRVRLKEDSFINEFDEIMNKIIASDFLSGKKPSKEHPNFKADFDWIIANNTNYIKILEGKYDGKQGGRSKYAGIEKDG